VHHLNSRDLWTLSKGTWIESLGRVAPPFPSADASLCDETKSDRPSIASVSEPVTAHSPPGDLAPMQQQLGGTTLVLGIGKKQRGVVPSGEGADLEKPF